MDGVNKVKKGWVSIFSFRLYFENSEISWWTCVWCWGQSEGEEHTNMMRMDVFRRKLFTFKDGFGDMQVTQVWTESWWMRPISGHDVETAVLPVSSAMVFIKVINVKVLLRKMLHPLISLMLLHVFVWSVESVAMTTMMMMMKKRSRPATST